MKKLDDYGVNDVDNQGKVSIVIPVYNNESYIEHCLKSVCQQTYDNLEIIVVIDGSTDASEQIVDNLALEDARIVVLKQENKGVSNARNNGVCRATGKYLTFIDGDDYIGINYICDLVDCAESKQAQMVICGMKKVNMDGTVIEEIMPGEYIRYEHEEWAFRICTVACHFYQKELWDRYEVLFQEGERGEDIPIALLFAGVCERVATLKQAEYYYVQHGSSAMHNFQGLKTNGLPYKALEGAIQKVQEIGLKNDPEFHELFVLRVLATFIQLAKGAGQEEIQRMGDYIVYILDTYYPKYYKNKKVKVFSNLEIPFAQKIAVRVLILVNRMKLLSVFLKIVC